MKNMLITGGAGFIGSNFIKLILNKHKNINIINLDALTYAGNHENIAEFDDRHIFIKGSINNKKLLLDIFERYPIDTVVNFAAESHVDRSISDPRIFMETNILGTQTLLDVCRKYWEEGETNSGQYYRDSRFIQISTDEVYGTLGSVGKFSEKTPISPNSPYSASKASADLIARAYNKTYNFPVIITRCSNNYGPNQFPEKLIPLTITNALNNKTIPVYGNGLQVRDWIFVEDHCLGVEQVILKGKLGEIYNIGCENEWTNIDIIKLILSKLNKPKTLIKHVKDRPGHDTRYAMDNRKIKSDLNWKPTYTFEEGIELTIQWYLNNQNWIDNILNGTYLKISENIR